MKNITGLLIVVFALLSACTHKTEAILPPYVTGIPPKNAYTGLVRLDDGEIRHYGPGCYVSSKDGGATWDTVPVANGNHYGKKDPSSGEYLRVFSEKSDSVFSLRSVGGIDGKWTKTLIDVNGAIMIKPIVYVDEGKRAIAAFHTHYRNGCGVYYSDDAGLNWKKSNQVQAPPHRATGFHKGERWNHGAVEPTVVELQDGRLWMLIRTAQDQLYESFSKDKGSSWSTPVPSRFYGTITMPSLQRLKNGSLLLIWNNTTPLPELAHPNSFWEDVFTNRDVLHAAISDDDGKTWEGFREIYLNPLRNDSLMATRFGPMGSLDRSVQQSEMVEIEDNKVLVALGQHPEFRKFLVLDTNWLYETQSADNFANGLQHWTYHQYIKGIQGHCAYNRKPGARMVPHPNREKDSVMHLLAIRDTTLLSQDSGALYNFPAANKGEIHVRLMGKKGFDGLTLSLHDRWFNPTDTVAQHYSMFNFQLDPATLATGVWHDLTLEWDLGNASGTAAHCRLLLDGRELYTTLLKNPSLNGINYIHFLLPLEGDRNEGILIESIRTIRDLQ